MSSKNCGLFPQTFKILEEILLNCFLLSGYFIEEVEEPTKYSKVPKKVFH
jgi:hypothetical protein